jgi:hypothetical protein
MHALAAVVAHRCHWHTELPSQAPPHLPHGLLVVGRNVIGDPLGCRRPQRWAQAAAQRDIGGATLPVGVWPPCSDLLRSGQWCSLP